jgi:4-amino-4-deoxy-L-arabinose transferase-like glycosyltransferase
MPRTSLIVLVAALALSVFLTPLRRELYVGDETKYAQVVREMRGGAFFLPTLEGTPFTHKPPLHFWAIDLLTRVFGLYSVWPFVLPSIAAFFFLLWLMWRMGGPLAAFVCGSSLMIWGSAQSARMDVMFTALVVLAVWLYQRERIVPAGAVLGIATLVKGLMAPVIGIVLVLFEWMRRKRVPRGNYLAAIGLMVLIPLLWFVPAMIMGGEAYTQEVLVKQTAGRAVGAWVHKAAPWFYLVRAPADLFPWFFLLVVALIAVYKRNDEQAKFYVSWILAVLIPYSLLSSKLDVYMMTMIPPASLLVARFVEWPADRWSRWGWRVNLFVLALLVGIGVTGYVLLPRYIAPTPALRGLFIVLALAALVATFFARNLLKSTLAVGTVPVVALIYVAIFLVPMANELASARPLVGALLRQRVDPERIALYATPHLWTRAMPRDLERVRRVSAEEAQMLQPEVIVTSRKKAGELPLAGYRKVDEFQMIGKWFDVYRR